MFIHASLVVEELPPCACWAAGKRVHSDLNERLYCFVDFEAILLYLRPVLKLQFYIVGESLVNKA